MGTSAGGMNMSDEYVDECTVCEGMALNHFSFEAHFDHDNTALIEGVFLYRIKWIFMWRQTKMVLYV